MLARPDFASAVKDALRHFTQPDILVRSPLLQTNVMEARVAGTPTVQDLCVMLAETAELLFANVRDQKLYRVLDLTYLNPVPKQEVAADRLNLSFGTYRRYLAAGINRIIDWLWEQEQNAPRRGSPPEQATACASCGEKTGTATARRRLSIVVLPFLNLSQDPAVDYFVDGLVDNLLTDLSRALPGSVVISRSTAFTYKGRHVATRQIGQELRVHYVLEGSVLTDQGRVVVNVQLVDAETEEHLWAERFELAREEILEVQDEIVARLARSVGVEMIRSEAARRGPTSSDECDAADLIMRGRALTTEIGRKENAAQAVALFKRALALAPANVEAMVGLASTNICQVMNLYAIDDRDQLLKQAEDWISRAIALMPDHIGVLKARALLLRARGRFLEAVAAATAVIARNPGEPTAYRELGLNKLYLGATQEAVDWFLRADRIAPSDRVRWSWLEGRGRALMQLGRDVEAADTLRLALASNPSFSRGRALLAAAEALAGNIECAKLNMAEFAAQSPGMTVRRFFEQGSAVPLDRVSPVYLLENERILDGLRRAGMPEERAAQISCAA
jgi:TolB-like protein